MNKRLLAGLLFCMVCTFVISGCGKSNVETDTTAQAETEKETFAVTDKQQAELDFLLGITDSFLPVYTEYKYAGDVEINDYNCCRFEFYNDELFLGAVAKAYDEEVMFWDADHGKYMYMTYENGWYVTGRYVDEPETENNQSIVNDVVDKIDDGISGQYTCILGSFYITMYAEDYVGDADGYFRAAGVAEDENGTSKSYSIAGEIFKTEADGEEVYMYNGAGGEEMEFRFDSEGVYISDKGIHSSDNVNLTGKYLIDFYY